VFTARTDTFLHRSGAGIASLFLSEENVLEGDHARIGEQQGGVALGNQRTAGHQYMALPFKIFQEFFSQLVAGHNKLSNQKESLEHFC